MWQFDESAADCRRRCKKCSIVFKVPTLAEISRAVDVVSRAKGKLYVDQDGRQFG